MIDGNPLGFAGTLIAMMVAVYSMRAGGYWLMGRFYIGPRVHRMLDALPGAVIAASVVPIVVKGGVSALCAVTAAVVVMRVVRNDFAALIAGVGVAALARLAGL